MILSFRLNKYEFEREKKYIENIKNNDLPFRFGNDDYRVASFDFKEESFDNFSVELCIVKSAMFDIEVGDYVSTNDRELQTRYNVNRETLYKVKSIDCMFMGEKYLTLCGLEGTMFKAKLFKKVEVK